MPGAAPSTDAEVWRYSRIPALDLAGFLPARAAAGDLPVLPADVQAIVDGIGQRSGLAVTLDGHLADLTVTEGSKLAVAVGTADADLGPLHAPADLLADLHAAALSAPVSITAPRHARVEAPFVIIHLVSPSAAGHTVAPRVAVHAGEDASVSVVEILASLDPDTPARVLVLPVTTVVVDRAARAQHLSVQLLGRADVVVAHQASRIDADGAFLSLAVALGGSIARLRSDSALVGRGADSAILAAYLGDDDQQHDFRTLQEHVAPKTTSDLVFKGAVAGRSHSVYSGLIRVVEGAKGTRATQTNRNLVLSEEAHADSVPNLEIDENDLSCSHASAVGPIDEEQRFYLESRGVPPVEADRLIIAGFLADVVDRCPVRGAIAPLRAMLEARVEAVDVTATTPHTAGVSA